VIPIYYALPWYWYSHTVFIDLQAPAITEDQMDELLNQYGLKRGPRRTLSEWMTPPIQKSKGLK
jgi:hypothetical protein